MSQTSPWPLTLWYPTTHQFNDARLLGGLLKKIEEVYYLTPLSMTLLARRNRISPRTIENRLLSYLDDSMERHHHDLTHNRGMLEIVRIFHRHGIEVAGGFRDVYHVQYVTQVQPDGLLYVNGPWGPGLYFLEYERSAEGPEAITEKLRTYRRLRGLGVQLRVIWITDRQRAAELFRRRAGNIDVMVATLDELRQGQIAGPNAIWRRNGPGHAELKPL